jgi:hypothetical protein
LVLDFTHFAICLLLHHAVDTTTSNYLIGAIRGVHQNMTIVAQADPYATTPEEVMSNATSLTAVDLSQDKELQGNTKLRRNIQKAIQPLSTFANSANMTVGQLRVMKKEGKLVQGRLPTNTAVTPIPSQAPTIVTKPMTAESRYTRNRLSSSCASQGHATATPVESPMVPFAMMDNSMLSNSTPATTPITKRSKRIRETLLESDLGSHERLYDLMTGDENNPRNGQIRRVIGDSIAVGWDTPKAIGKIIRINERALDAAAAATASAV